MTYNRICQTFILMFDKSVDKASFRINAALAYTNFQQLENPVGYSPLRYF